MYLQRNHMTRRRFSNLARVVEEYYDELLGFVVRRTGSRPLAEEIVHETWIRASITRVVMPGNPRAYVYSMVRNLVIDHHRHHSVRQMVELSPVPHDENSEGENCAPQHDVAVPSHEDMVSARQELALISDVVTRLPQKCRQVFLMYRGQELSMSEIAKTLDISVRTVENHIARAMVECRRCLQDARREL